MVVSAVGPIDRCIMRLGTGVAMSNARSDACRPQYPTRDDPAHVPAGTPQSALRRIPSDLLKRVGSLGLFRPRLERKIAAPHGVHNDAELARYRHGGVLEAHALCKILAPGFDSRILPHARQQAGGSLEQVSSHQPIASPGNTPGSVNLARLIARRGEPEISANRTGVAEVLGCLDCRGEACGHDDADPGTRHQQTAGRIAL